MTKDGIVSFKFCSHKNEYLASRYLLQSIHTFLQEKVKPSVSWLLKDILIFEGSNTD